MSNVIKFLESVGSKMLPASEYAAAIAKLDVDDTEREALIGRDREALGLLLGARPKMYCIVVAPGEEEDAPESPEDAPDEQQSED